LVELLLLLLLLVLVLAVLGSFAEVLEHCRIHHRQRFHHR
jgi:hypothetical protein